MGLGLEVKLCGIARILSRHLIPRYPVYPVSSEGGAQKNSYTYHPGIPKQIQGGAESADHFHALLSRTAKLPAAKLVLESVPLNCHEFLRNGF